MNRREYGSILISPIVLILYTYWLHTIYQLCLYGGGRSHAPVIIGIGAVLLLWVLLWTALYFVWGRKRPSIIQSVLGGNPRILTAVFLVEAAALLLCTAFYGYRIYQTAIPYNGQLAWYIDELKNKRQVPLTEDQFYETGMEGVLSALEEELDVTFKDEIYVSGNFNLSVDESGAISSVYAYLFAPDEDGSIQSYLISYNAGMDSTMTVWLNGEVSSDYLEQKRLQPMREMIQAFLESDQFSGQNLAYSFQYEGYQEEAYSSNWYLLSDGALTTYPSSNYGMSVSGYMMTVSAQDSTVATVVSDVDSLQTIAEIVEEEQREEAQETGKTLITDQSGDMTFYLNDSVSMSLQTVDAAAGSRWYSFSSSTGITNSSPFAEYGGVAEGIYFIDENIGWILLSSPSSDYSRMFYTDNGGADFVQVALPLEDARSDLEENQLELAFDDFAYIDVPYEEDGAVYVNVSTSAADLSYISAVFVSQDQGATWTYDRVEENWIK